MSGNLDQFGELARTQVRHELHDEILPLNHPISRHVRRVVQRILTSNNLGIVKGGMNVHSLPTRLTLGEFGGDIWEPDTDFRQASSVSGSSLSPEKEWDVIVVNNPKMINAMAVPGMVVVYTGILPVCRDEQGLSAVLSHEIGHIVARHTAEHLSSQTVAITILIVLDLLGVDFGLSRLMKKLMLELPNSRTQEREADLIGLRLMSRACFDPMAAPKMFEQLDKIDSRTASKVNLDFFQTHPSSKSRVEYLKQALPEGYAIRAANPECSDQEEQVHAFREAAQGIRVVNLPRGSDGEPVFG
ncbi:hypothetical protein AX17_001775 [Amanita inopinata Kibby_2008]|nr:hypothetical protein AX17_001775 [Amanita inopinata Kibby_2008]